jgi:Zn-dependent M16 (insulinase) family peptidase
LIFCGSKNYPYRGYLDSLANRCLSTGTNAYTMEDNTGYTLVTAGAEGTINILPIFLDHVIQPTLRPYQFLTEIYHIDGTAKQKGVVYCEMASRENTEPDLLDLHLRMNLFQNKSTYSYECGGKTKDIKNLTNDEIIEYHKKFYDPSNISVIICGLIDKNKVLQSLEEVPELLCSHKDSSVVDIPAIEYPPFPVVENNLITETVHFPVSDDDVGSISYAWRGPALENLKDIIGLDVIFRYLYETSASPLCQRFIERKVPLASDVDFELKGTVDSSLLLIFSGVPYITEANKDQGEEAESENNDDDNNILDEMSISKDANDANTAEEYEIIDNLEDLFKPGVFFEKLMEIFKNFAENGFPNENMIKKTIDRHRIKIYEGLEEDPHEILTTYVIQDLLRYNFAVHSELHDAKHENATKPIIGTRNQIFNILNELESYPQEFWKNLIKKYITDAVTIEVLMVPDPDLANEQASKEIQDQEDRIKELGPEKLKRLDEELEKAIKDNEINIPQKVLDNMPPIPDVTKIPLFRGEATIKSILDEKEVKKQQITLNNNDLPSPVQLIKQYDLSRPFSFIQYVKTDTFFSQVKIYLNTVHIPEELRDYFVLFQEMLFCTPVEIPKELTKDNKPKLMSYQSVVENTSELCTSNEASLGIGNEIFHVSYLSETFVISASSERNKYNELCEWMMMILMFSKFNEERIISTAKNLLSQLTETKREGSEMLSAISTKIIAECNNDNSNTSLLNDLAISVFNQETFLQKIITFIKEGKTNEIIQNLEEIQKCILKSIEMIAKEADESKLSSIIYKKKEIVPGFVQLAMPYDYDHDPIQEFLACWDKCYKIYQNQLNSYSMEITSNVEINKKINYNNLYKITSTFPFPRKPFNINSIDEAHRSVMVPIAGLCTSFLIQYVESEVLSPMPNEDIYAVTILAELLTRTEGPLYTSIRGNGYAYDGSLCLYLWSGQLAFSLYDSSEPQKATMEFYQIIEEMNTEEGWAKICSDFHIDTAKASVVYKNVSSKSTASGVIYSYLRGALRGFVDSGEDILYNKYVQEVTSADLKRVYNKYYRQFLDPSKRFTVMTTIIGDATEHIREAFAHPDLSAYSALDKNHPEKYAIPFQENSMESLKIQYDPDNDDDIDKMSIYTQ